MTIALDELLDAGDEPPPPRKLRRRGLTIVGVLLIAIGLGLVGYLVWQYYITNLIAEHRQQEIIDSLEQQWSEPDGTRGTEAEGVYSGATGESVASRPQVTDRRTTSGR